MESPLGVRPCSFSESALQIQTTTATQQTFYDTRYPIPRGLGVKTSYSHRHIHNAKWSEHTRGRWQRSRELKVLPWDCPLKVNTTKDLRHSRRLGLPDVLSAIANYLEATRSFATFATFATYNTRSWAKCAARCR